MADAPAHLVMGENPAPPVAGAEAVPLGQPGAGPNPAEIPPNPLGIPVEASKVRAGRWHNFAVGTTSQRISKSWFRIPTNASMRPLRDASGFMSQLSSMVLGPQLILNCWLCSITGGSHKPS